MVTALAGTSIVASARGQCRRMKLVNRSPIGGLKRQVNPRHSFAGLVDKELVGIEVVGALNERSGEIERFQDRTVETLARLEVRHP